MQISGTQTGTKSTVMKKPRETNLFFKRNPECEVELNKSVFFSLLVRLALSFSCNYERVPVYSALHLQPDLHVCFNHALRNKNGMNQISVKLKICIGVKSSVKIQNRTLFCLFLCYTYHDGRDTIRYQLNLVLLLLLLICSAPNHQSE